MGQDQGVWRLVRGDELLAELVVIGGNFPWLNAEVRPEAGFAEVRPLFDDEIRRADLMDEEMTEIVSALRRGSRFVSSS